MKSESRFDHQSIFVLSMPGFLHFATTTALEITYEQTGSVNGKPILLLHGFPYDVRVYDGVREPLAAAGWRVIIPYLRGYGSKCCWNKAVFTATARSFDNLDFVAVVIQSYRHRHGNALERRPAEQPEIAVPTIALRGADDGVEPPKSSDKEAKFTARDERRVLPGVGHCPPLEAPAEVIRAIGTLASYA